MIKKPSGDHWDKEIEIKEIKTWLKLQGVHNFVGSRKRDAQYRNVGKKTFFGGISLIIQLMF